MYANTQGFAPGMPQVSDMVSEDQSAGSFSYEASGEASASGIPLPTPSPESADAQLREPATMTAGAQPLVQQATAVDALNRGLMQSAPAQAGSNLYAAAPQAQVQTQVAAPVPQPTAQSPATGETGNAVATNLADPSEQQAEAPRVQELAVVAPPKKQSMFARLFAPQAKAKRSAPSGTTKRVAAQPEPKRVAMASAGGALPGVNLRNVLGTDLGSDSTESSTTGNVQLASAAGLARLAPNGLRTQTDRVEIDCFKPQLVRVLKSVERHYGRPVVVTSGYRSPKHNRRIGGASGSRHTSCEAADIQIDGVSKWQLAKYLRSMPGRGGVGTYCHTESVHIDVGNTRDWNWRCRRRK
ncbi:D-Ala-D-Ala carboxypeptidase family metallohydrolase [Hoeflea sp.]|uniref:D-Ala-D-Ala carboxypeptidase family metallohydrolase n=1 Tax=Hoeflea sp. TaxID=1940281 RepID=UPI003BB028B3